MSGHEDWLPDEPWRGWAMFGGAALALSSCGWAAVAGWLADIAVIAGLVIVCAAYIAPRRVPGDLGHHEAWTAAVRLARQIVGAP